MEKYNNNIWTNSYTDKYVFLAPICTTNAKLVGQEVVITANITQGTAPFDVTFTKDSVSINTTQLLSIGSATQYYIVTENDIGNHLFGIVVSDSCSPTPYTTTEECTVSIYPLACTSPSKIVGENVTLTVNIIQGTAPYTITYKKDGVTLETPVTASSIGTYTYVYTTVPGDEGTHTFSAEVVDNCTNPEPQTWTDQCSVTINALPLCTQPSCSFTVV